MYPPGMMPPLYEPAPPPSIVVVHQVNTYMYRESQKTRDFNRRFRKHKRSFNNYKYVKYL